MTDTGAEVEGGEAARIEELLNTGLLDSAPDANFDRFTRLASELLQASVSLVSLVDHDRQFFLSEVGLDEPWASRRQTPLSHSFCRHVVGQQRPLIVEDARTDPRVRGNPAIHELQVVAYLGVPLVTRRGRVLGSFCAVDGQPRRWSEAQVALMEDLAAAVMTEIELRRLTTQSLEQLAALRHLEQLRDDMVHMLVHDLRDPLGSLAAGLDVLELLPGSTDEHHAYVEVARRGTRVLQSMIDELLTVRRSEAGRLELHLTELVPAALIDDAVAQLAHAAEAAGVAVDVDVATGVPPAFCGDAAKLRRVLVNLVGNALDHTPRGGRVRAEARPRANGILFSVTDTGAGIPAADLNRIFRKYEQLSGSTRRRTGAAGLGLPFCKAVVEEHGGEIWAESEVGKGASIRFTLPLAAAG